MALEVVFDYCGIIMIQVCKEECIMKINVKGYFRMIGFIKVSDALHQSIITYIKSENSCLNPPTDKSLLKVIRYSR